MTTGTSSLPSIVSDAEFLQELGRDAVGKDVRKAVDLQPDSVGFHLKSVADGQFFQDGIIEMDQDVATEFSHNEPLPLWRLHPDLNLVADRR